MSISEKAARLDELYETDLEAFSCQVIDWWREIRAALTLHEDCPDESDLCVMLSEENDRLIDFVKSLKRELASGRLVMRRLPIVDAETVQVLLDLLNPLHGSADKQIMDQVTDERELDAPSDREYNINVTARMERDLTQAVCILEDRKRQFAAAPPAPVQEDSDAADNERLAAALKSQTERTWQESDRADKADHMRVAIETGKVHPALAIDLKEHRLQAYQNGWNDGYAEGFAKAKSAALAAASPAPVQEERWQPIETAPKDGTAIWLWVGQAAIGYYDPPLFDEPGKWLCKSSFQRRNRKPDEVFGCNVLDREPKYWQPLPTAPVIVADKDAKS